MKLVFLLVYVSGSNKATAVLYGLCSDVNFKSLKKPLSNSKIYRGKNPSSSQMKNIPSMKEEISTVDNALLEGGRFVKDAN